MLQELPQRGYFNGEELKCFAGEISKMISKLSPTTYTIFT